jgi:L-gulono-1,4-lactone dehydrogenase
MATRRSGPIRNGVFRTWGRTQTAVPAAVDRPTDEHGTVAAVIRAAELGRRVKVVGSGHSFTDIACTDGVLVDIAALRGVRHIDPATGRVTVGAGTVLHDLNVALRRAGLALPNLGDIDHQTIAGATATGTHGTGAGFACISNAIVGARLVAGDGSVVTCSAAERPDLLAAVQVGLGALGIVTELTLQCVPAFDLHAVETTEHIDAITERFDQLADTEDHVEFYWFPHTTTGQLKVNNRTAEPIRRRGRVEAFVADELTANLAFGALCRLGARAPRTIVPLIDAAVRPGGRVDQVAPSHEVFCSNRRVRFAEMEYAVPRAALLEAFGRVRHLVDHLGTPISFPIEVRVLGADTIPLSTASGRDSGYIAVHVYRGSPHEAYFGAVERIMEDYDGRPHWGKLHRRRAATLAPLYPGWDAFARVRDELDPDRVFANAYLDRVLDDRTT